LISINIAIVKRKKPLPKWLIPLLSLISGILTSLLILYVVSHGSINPLDVLIAIGNSITQPNLLLKNYAMLLVIGCGLLISFKAAIWNIGGEGQFYFAVIGAAWFALYSGLAEIPIINKFLMIALGLTTALIWILIAALIRGYIGLDEVPVTLLMNYIAYNIVDYLVNNHWREQVYRYTRTPTIPVETWFTNIPFTNATLELLLITLVTILLTWIILNYTYIGLFIRTMGSNPNVLKTIGVDVSKTIIYVLIISGLLIGLAGVSYLAGDTHLISSPVIAHTPYYGYTGILVAWLSLLELKYLFVTTYIVSALINAGINIQIVGVGGASIVNLMIGSILLTYTILFVFHEYSVKIIIKK